MQSHKMPLIKYRNLLMTLTCFGVVIVMFLLIKNGDIARDQRRYPMFNIGNAGTKNKILIWILTNPAAHQIKCKPIKETWGSRCDKLLFMSSQEDSTIPTIGLNVKEGPNHLTIKTFAAYEYIYAHHFQDADWFMKADDDTYVILENLKDFLSNKNPNVAAAYGLHMKRNDSGSARDYLHGGSGYILSKEALRRFAERHTKECVHWDIATEDIMLSWCLQKLNVQLLDTRDKYGAERLLYATPERHLFNKYLETYRTVRVGIENAPSAYGGMSQYPITFHKVSPQDMYLFDLYMHYFQRRTTEE